MRKLYCMRVMESYSYSEVFVVAKTSKEAQRLAHSFAASYEPKKWKIKWSATLEQLEKLIQKSQVIKTLFNCN